MKPLYRTTAAIRDLVEQATYLGMQSPGLETRFLDAVEETLEGIAESPQIGGVYENRNPRLQGLRVWRPGRQIATKNTKRHKKWQRARWSLLSYLFVSFCVLCG